MFIDFDRTAHVPIYLQINESICDLIGQGKLRPGDRLPSTRQLATTLGLNRMTVFAAFSKLEADGRITSQVGRGTFVSYTNPAAERKPLAAALLDPEALSRLWSPLFNDLQSAPTARPTVSPRQSARMISFKAAAPTSELFPAVEFRRCMDFVLKRRVTEISTLGPSDGLPSLKAYLVRWFAQNGIEVSEDEVLVTTGCQQSMDLIRRVLVAPGDALMLENPTYPGAIGALTPSAGERLELPIQGYRPDLAAFGSPGRCNRCKLIYVVPNFHNPTGKSMPRETRQQLVAIVSQRRIPIMEDDVFGELRYGGAVMPALKALCPHLVIYIGSFSKMLNPALRVGWVVAPRPVIKQLNTVKQASDLHTNVLMQAALDEFCRRDLLHRHLKRVQRIFQRRRDAMAEALQRWFPSEARWTLPEGGLSMWVSLAPECNTDELLRLAEERGVQFLPGSVFYFRSPACNSLRLSFAAESEQRIQEGIRLLGDLLGSERSRPYSPGRWSGRRLAPPIM